MHSTYCSEDECTFIDNLDRVLIHLKIVEGKSKYFLSNGFSEDTDHMCFLIKEALAKDGAKSG